MPHTHVRGIDVHYEEYGGGSKYLLMAHGLLGSVAATAEAAQELAHQGLHVFSYDARGHGNSGFTLPSQDYYRTALTDDMLGFIDALGLPRVSLYGTSMGAGSALLLAMAHPERVARLVLRSPPGVGADGMEARKTMSRLAFLYRTLGASATARIVALVRGRRAGNMPAMLRAQCASAMASAIRGLLIEGPEFPIQDLKSVVAPTLILAHKGDPPHPLTSAELLRDRLRDANLEVAENAEYWQLHPQETASRVVAFVASEGSSVRG